MGDAARPSALSSLLHSTGRNHRWRANIEARCRVQPGRRTLHVTSYKRFIGYAASDGHSLALRTRYYGGEIRQNEALNLSGFQQARLLFGFRPSANANEAPSQAERLVEAQRIQDAMPMGERSASDAQYLGMSNEVQRSVEQARDGIDTQEVDGGTGMPQRSIEEDYGLLKEQVEADRRIQLASKQGSNAEGVADTVRPLKRSKIIAKQVISQSSARIIGFVSQLWVSARLFKVVALEVRPSLLSGEVDRVFLADICQIGDVILVNDESALENEITALDCETLVGYDVVTENGNDIGKIRDFSFDFEDGKLTSLDFDSVGFSMVPSSLISTYRLDVEEVMEILPDCVLVKAGGETRIRRLTKGFWQLPNAGEKRRSQKIARSRMQKRGFTESASVAGQRARPLPSSMKPRYFESTDFGERSNGREEPLDHSFWKESDGSPPRHRSQ